jgi:hypothetical protein
MSKIDAKPQWENNRKERWHAFKLLCGAMGHRRDVSPSSALETIAAINKS